MILLYQRFDPDNIILILMYMDSGSSRLKNTIIYINGTWFYEMSSTNWFVILYNKYVQASVICIELILLFFVLICTHNIVVKDGQVNEKINLHSLKSLHGICIVNI